MHRSASTSRRGNERRVPIQSVPVCEIAYHVPLSTELLDKGCRLKKRLRVRLKSLPICTGSSELQHRMLAEGWRYRLDNQRRIQDDSDMINQQSVLKFRQLYESPEYLGCASTEHNGVQIFDAGIECPGGLEAGLALARLCMGDLADVQIVPLDAGQYAVNQGVWVRTDQPIMSCLGCQYAGWPIKGEDFFAMGSGPMRLARGREEVLESLKLSERVSKVVGVLETEVLPNESALDKIATDCRVDRSGVKLAVAPATSIAGSVQVVARSVETAMHKLHELHFDVGTIVSATGIAPLPPPAKRGDFVDGIGRTNDAMLYGATVTLWVDHDDEAIDDVIDRVPAGASPDYGQPFAKIFKGYNYDFYQVDPLLFSPARVTVHNLRSGKTFDSGQLDLRVLTESFSV